MEEQVAVRLAGSDGLNVSSAEPVGPAGTGAAGGDDAGVSHVVSAPVPPIGSVDVGSEDSEDVDDVQMMEEMCLNDHLQVRILDVSGAPQPQYLLHTVRYRFPLFDNEVHHLML